MSLYKEDESFDDCGNCLSVAEEKFDSVSKIYPIFDNNTLKYPIMVVNLYTQELPRIYSTVNRHLLRGLQNEVWQVFTSLLTRAIDVLSPLINKKCDRFTVYRGQGCYPVADIGQTYQFRRFSSTTFNPWVALAFSNGECTTFIKIDKAFGLPVEIFSKYQSEEEVILKSDSVFRVHNKLNSTADESVKDNITNEIQNIIGAQPDPYQYNMPDIFVHLIMEENTRKKKKREDVPYLMQKRSSKDMDNLDNRLEIQHSTRTTRAATEMIIDEIDLWKKHLRSSYDGKYSADVPDCIAKSTISSSVPIGPDSKIMIIFLAVTYLTLYC